MAKKYKMYCDTSYPYMDCFEYQSDNDQKAASYAEEFCGEQYELLYLVCVSDSPERIILNDTQRMTKH